MITMDAIILILTGALAAGIAIILWKASARAPSYDPDRVDKSAGFDPSHDYLSPEHAKRIHQLEQQETRTAKHTIPDRKGWDDHLTRPPSKPEPVASQNTDQPTATNTPKGERRQADRRVSERRKA